MLNVVVIILNCCRLPLHFSNAIHTPPPVWHGI